MTGAAKSECTVVANIIGVLKHSDAEVSEVILAGIATLGKFCKWGWNVREKTIDRDYSRVP